MKQINQKLKEIGRNRGLMLFCSLLCMFLLSTIVGLGDWDFIWQTYLGKVIVTEQRFDGLRDLVWGTQDIATYLDHEWLTNVIFYLLTAVFGKFGAIVIFKIVLEVLFAISMYKLLQQFTNFKDLSWFTYLACCVTTYSFAQILVKPKAYDLSVILFIWLIIQLEKYRKSSISFKHFVLDILGITILWNNLHSGSVLVIYAVVGLYWIFFWRDLKTVILGIINIGALCVNPFGYKLIQFDLLHGSDEVMKNLVQEWSGFDLETNAGKTICIIFVVAFLHLLHMSREKENWIYIALFLLFTIMTVDAKRHFLYVYPIIMILYIKGQFKDLDKWRFENFLVPTLFIMMVTIVVQMLVWMTMPNFEKTYTMEYVTPELQEVMTATMESNDGLYDGGIDVWSSGFKSFMTGAFPYTRNRNIANYLLNHGSAVQIETIINKYQLDKFLVFRTVKSDAGFVVNTNMYDYLRTNDKYELLYEDNILAYFVERKDK